MSQKHSNLGNPDFVTSKDGAKIGFYTIGSGPSVVIIPGALSLALKYEAFAQELAKTFTVHIIERRGHGVSGAQDNNYSITKEREDVLAVLAKTKAAYVVGHSYGGLVALETSRNNPAIKKLAVYEPGVSVDGSIPAEWFASYEQKLQGGKLDDAFIIFIKAMNPESRRTPNWLLKLILPRVLGKVSMQQIRDQLSTNLNEHREVARLDNSYENYRQVTMPTLIMAGGKTVTASPSTGNLLVKILPKATLKKFPKLDHFGIDEHAPKEVANAVRDFLLN